MQFQSTLAMKKSNEVANQFGEEDNENELEIS